MDKDPWSSEARHSLCKLPMGGEQVMMTSSGVNVRVLESWIHVPGKLKQIDAGDMEVWGVNSGDDIFKRSVDGSGRLAAYWRKTEARLSLWEWLHLGSELQMTTFSSARSLVMEQWVHIGGKLKQIDGGYGYVYGVNSNDDIFTMNIDGSEGWRQIPGKLTHITASGRDEVFGVNSAGRYLPLREAMCNGEWEQIEWCSGFRCDATVDVSRGC